MKFLSLSLSLFRSTPCDNNGLQREFSARQSNLRYNDRWSIAKNAHKELTLYPPPPPFFF